MNLLNSKLLEAIVCPLTKKTLRYDKINNELVSDEAYLAFPIENNVPIITIESARKIKDQPKKQ